MSCCVEFHHDGGAGAAVAGELDLVERMSGAARGSGVWCRGSSNPLVWVMREGFGVGGLVAKKCV